MSTMQGSATALLQFMFGAVLISEYHNVQAVQSPFQSKRQAKAQKDLRQTVSL